MLEVLIGVETFTSTSSFDTLSLQFVRMNELRKFMLGLQLFPFSPIQCLLSVGIQSYFTQRDVIGRDDTQFTLSP